MQQLCVRLLNQNVAIPTELYFIQLQNIEIVVLLIICMDAAYFLFLFFEYLIRLYLLRNKFHVIEQVLLNADY